MTRIETVKAREILDLPGNPTVEVNVQLSGGAKAAAANLGIKSGWAYRRDRMAKHKPASKD